MTSGHTMILIQPMTIPKHFSSYTGKPQPISLDGVRTMARNKEFILGMQHIRVNYFSFRLRYLKALIKMYTLKEELKEKFRR
jgi:hypothetical protein